MQNLGELRTAFEDTLSRTDLTRFADFVRLVEKDIARRLNTISVEVSAAITFTGGEATVPTGMKQIRSLKSDQDGGIVLSNLDVLTAERVAANTLPSGYVVEGEKIKVVPTAGDGAFTIKYFGPFTGMTSDTDSNEILLEHPDVYLYGTCLHASIVLKDAEGVARFGQLYEIGMSAFEDWLEVRRYGSSLKRVPG